jgi:hypothetical protein
VIIRQVTCMRNCAARALLQRSYVTLWLDGGYVTLWLAMPPCGYDYDLVAMTAGAFGRCYAQRAPLSMHSAPHIDGGAAAAFKGLLQHLKDVGEACEAREGSSPDSKQSESSSFRLFEGCGGMGEWGAGGGGRETGVGGTGERGAGERGWSAPGSLPGRPCAEPARA